MLIPDPFVPPERTSLSLEGVFAFIGIPCGPEIPYQTAKSLLVTTTALQKMGVPHQVCFVSGCSIVEVARNKVVKEFLASKATHLFMVDSDIDWIDEDFIRALALGTKLPLVVGAYVAKRDPLVFMMGRNTGQRMESNELGCLPVSGMGLGFCCAQRAVIEKLAQNAPDVKCFGGAETLRAVFQCDIVDGEFRGEDIRFFEDAASHGYQCWLEPNIKLGHVGQKVYSATISNCLQRV